MGEFSKPYPPYKVYRALLTQAGTAAPTAVELENSLGAGVWSRFAAGRSRLTLTGAFLANKVSNFGGISVGSIPAAFEDVGFMTGKRGTDNYFEISTRLAGSLADDVLVGDYIEILVYP